MEVGCMILEGGRMFVVDVGGWNDDTAVMEGRGTATNDAAVG